MGLYSLSPDPFFAFLFSFLFVRDTNPAHPIKHCYRLGLKRQIKKMQKCKIYVTKKRKTTAASLGFVLQYASQYIAKLIL